MSGFSLSKRALDGDPTYAINLDRIVYDKSKDTFYLFEYQKCEPTQFVTPWTSHPNRYWEKCRPKYLSIWRLVKKLNARLYVVNYADEGTPHADEVRVIEVKELNAEGIKECVNSQMTFRSFSEWFRRMNQLGK